MKDLNRKAFGGLLLLLISLAVFLFLPAWTLDYWQAWVFLAVYSLSTLAITLYFMKMDPKLLERRVIMGGEKQRSQKIIKCFLVLTFVAVIVFPAIDHRFAWSAVPPPVVVAGEALVVLGFVIMFFVFKENPFTSRIIEVEAEQKVIATGPYAVVRHPMYAGSLVMLSGVPPALGSWWGLFTIIPITLVIVWRLLDEEAFLIKNLPGYSEYRTRVRHRLVPLIW
ncbi:MAG: isoprenylcysteine carboxylmethyltransferase family protein [Verrucomicrobiota bacterium]|jgi:protein-S-isoprenylcysteine O-methyltransferase Ste14